MGDYIRYHEAEKLFKIYPTLQVIQKTLQTELSNICNADKDEEIYSECMGNRNGDGMPHSGAISDTTASVALRYKTANRREKIELRKEINDLGVVIEKLTCAITSMRYVQRLILETYYWTDQNTWKEVVEALKEKNIYMSESKAKRTRSCAIGYIATVSKVAIGQYQFVMGLVD